MEHLLHDAGSMHARQCPRTRAVGPQGCGCRPRLFCCPQATLRLHDQMVDVGFQPDAITSTLLIKVASAACIITNTISGCSSSAKELAVHATLSRVHMLRP